MVSGEEVERPSPSIARKAPPLIVVVPEYVFADEGLRIHKPPSALVRDKASLAFGLLRSRRRSLLSPSEVPPKVSVRLPVPEKERSAVLEKTSVALLSVAALLKLLPYLPEDWITALPAKVNSRSVLTDGVCVYCWMRLLAPV